MDRIRDIIVKEMSINREEEHMKLLRYLNKAAMLIYSEGHEDKFRIAILLHTLTYKLKGKKIPLISDWLAKLPKKFQLDKNIKNY